MDHQAQKTGEASMLWAQLEAEASKFSQDFAGVEIYCMFIGYPRSGHSLVGSLLDAHPNIIIAHELDALKYAGTPLTKEQLFYLLLDNSRRFTQQGRVWGEYSYQVPDQWQGRYQGLKVIGDKKGGLSSSRLLGNPELLARLRDRVRVRMKFIHVVRNPYDNISTISRKHATDLRGATDMYFAMAQSVLNLKHEIAGDDMLDLRHEAFVEEPKRHLRELCAFLGQDAPEDYLNACASIVFKSPRKTRQDAPWTGELLQLVKNRMEKFPFLQGYGYDD